MLGILLSPPVMFIIIAGVIGLISYIISVIVPAPERKIDTATYVPDENTAKDINAGEIFLHIGCIIFLLIAATVISTLSSPVPPLAIVFLGIVLLTVVIFLKKQ